MRDDKRNILNWWYGVPEPQPEVCLFCKETIDKCDCSSPGYITKGGG